MRDLFTFSARAGAGAPLFTFSARAASAKRKQGGLLGRADLLIRGEIRRQRQRNGAGRRPLGAALQRGGEADAAHAVHVVAAEPTHPKAGDALDLLHKLADDLGAEWHVLNRDDPARALVDFASEHQVTQIVLGSSRRSRGSRRFALST